MDNIRVAVRRVSGECLELVVEPRALVSHVKTQIADEWQVPEPFQELVLGTAILRDQDRVAEYCAGRTISLDITMMISTGGSQHDLVNGTLEEKCKALKDFSRLGLEAGPAIISLVAARIADESLAVKNAAVEGLAQIAEKGDAHAMDATLPHLVHKDTDVRMAALRAVSLLAKKGDQRAIYMVVARLADTSPQGPGADCAERRPAYRC